MGGEGADSNASQWQGGAKTPPTAPSLRAQGAVPQTRFSSMGAWAVPLPSNARPRPHGPLRAPAPSMAWQSWPAAFLWVASCGLLLLVLALVLSPRSCRARRTLRGLFMARSKRLFFRIGLVPGADAMRCSEGGRAGKGH